MKTIRKVYCRAYQTLFRAALPLLPYRNPKLKKAVEDIPAILAAEGASRPLIVTDSILRELEPMKKLEKSLQDKEILYAVYDGTQPNPTTRMVEEAVKAYRDHGCDCLIAFGGGSPMDCAKAAGARLAYPNKPLGKMAGILKVLKRIPLLIAVPTTAGTGSETTLAAVIVDPGTRHKYVINSFPLIPRYAVLDPAVLHSLPASLAAATGMDALTHAVEAYIGRSTTPETRRDAVRAVQLVFANIERSSLEKDRDAQEKMLLAAHLAGRAFTRSYVGYIHGVSHSLSGMYNMPHGRTNAILLPAVLEMYGPAAHQKLAELALAVGLGKDADPKPALAERFIEEIYALNKRLGIPDAIVGIREEDIDTLAAYADHESNPLYPVPVLWDKEELKAIYRRIASHEC